MLIRVRPEVADQIRKEALGSNMTLGEVVEAALMSRVIATYVRKDGNQ